MRIDDEFADRIEEVLVDAAEDAITKQYQDEINALIEEFQIKRAVR